MFTRSPLYPEFSIFVDGLLMVQYDLHRLNVLLVDGVKQSVPGLNLELYQQLDHFKIFIVYGHQQGSSAERVDAVDINQFSGMFQHSVNIRQRIRIKTNKIFPIENQGYLRVEATSPRSTARRNFFSSRDRAPEPREFWGRPVILSEQSASDWNIKTSQQFIKRERERERLVPCAIS